MSDVEKIVGYVEGENPDGTVRVVVGELRRPATYPSFYRVVHHAYNAAMAHPVLADDACEGDPEAYDPSEHACYPLAGAIRVGLHAEGVRLSNDGNGSARAEQCEADPGCPNRAWSNGRCGPHQPEPGAYH